MFLISFYNIMNSKIGPFDSSQMQLMLYCKHHQFIVKHLYKRKTDFAIVVNKMFNKSFIRQLQSVH